MNIELCSAGEVAKALGIELDTLYRYARKGRIRGMKVGKSWRFLNADVQTFLQQHQYRFKSTEYAKPAVAEPVLLSDVLRCAALESSQNAITCGTTTASYADIHKASNLLADRLLHHGVLPGDRVLLMMTNSPEFIASCFAVWKAGAIVVAEDPAIQDANLGAILQDCTPQALIADREVAARLDAGRHGLENLRAVYVKDQTFGLPGLNGVRVESLDTALENKNDPTHIRFNSISPDDIATITYPAGAAKGAKGVLNTHENWLAGAAFTVSHHELTRQDATLFALPLHQSAGMRQMLACMMAGARTILAANPEQAAKLMKAQRPSALALRPDGVKVLVEKFASGLAKAAGSLRYIEIDCAPLEKGGFESLRRLLPKTVIHRGCNLTEAQAGFLKAGADGVLNHLCSLPPTLKLRMVDEQHREVRPGLPGLLLLEGRGLMKGFWGQTDYAMSALKREGYCSGARATTGKHGDVTLLGREEASVNIRGHNVNLAEIEAVLRRHVRVADCAVVGLLDAARGFGKCIHAFIAPTAKGAMLTEQEMKTYCRTFLRSYKVPAHIHFQATLPKAPDGRILYEELNKAARGVGNSEVRIVNPEIPEFLMAPR